VDESQKLLAPPGAERVLELALSNHVAQPRPTGLQAGAAPAVVTADSINAALCTLRQLEVRRCTG
jgi:hypothetical protein